MLYRCPPDEIKDICNDSQRVFGWTIESKKGPISKTDQCCIEVEGLISKSVCMRIELSKSISFCRFYNFTQVDTVFLISDGVIEWQELRPSLATICDKMKQAIDTRIKKVPPKIPTPAQRTKKHISGKFFILIYRYQRKIKVFTRRFTPNSFAIFS